MRILLISGIVFVHVPIDPSTSPFLGTNGFFDWLRVFFGDSLFRIGVPCLSAISGYLLFRKGAGAFSYGATLWSKTKTVLVPFLIWNLSLFVGVLALQRAGMGVGYFPDLWNGSWRETLDYAFATEALPIDIPLYFLRDLFVCIVLSPVLAFLVKRFAVPTLAILFIVAILPDLVIYVVLKKSILFSFSFGIFLALNKVDVKRLDRFALSGTLAMLALAALLATALYATGPDFPWGLDLARNTLSIVGAGGFWLASAMLIKSRAGQRLAATGSLSFWMFCAHYPLLVLMWMVWKRVAGDGLYPVFYVSAIAIAFVLLALTNALCARYLPPVYAVLTGSRGRKAKIAAAMNASYPSAGLARPGEAALSQQRR
ncbi:MAG: acyltransferase [Neorhizobium sp.]|nr:acyltransferase [Neorhizobium sp.]